MTMYFLQCLANDYDSMNLESASDNTYIQILSLKQSSISGKSLSQLASKFMHTLCRLDVSWCNSIHGRDFEFLSGLKRFEELICNNSRRLDSNDVINLVLKLPTLRLLSCINCPLVKAAKIEIKGAGDNLGARCNQSLKHFLLSVFNFFCMLIIQLQCVIKNIFLLSSFFFNDKKYYRII